MPLATEHKQRVEEEGGEGNVEQKRVRIDLRHVHLGGITILHGGSSGLGKLVMVLITRAALNISCEYKLHISNRLFIFGKLPKKREKEEKFV